MAFFDLPPDEELAPATRQMLEEYRHLTGADQVPPTFRTYARAHRIVEARVKAAQNLGFHLTSFPWDAQCFAIMLIAHARRCRTCFAASRSFLDKLGFDEATLDAVCANLETLPMKERGRLFVHYALKIATDSANLKPKDFREMETNGFSKEEIQEIIAFAAYWNMTMVFSQSALAALSEE